MMMIKLRMGALNIIINILYRIDMEITSFGGRLLNMPQLKKEI